MANGTQERHRHFILDGVTDVEPYRSPALSVGRPVIPELDRQQHGTTLQAQIGELHQHADVARDVQQSAGLDDGLGIQIEFESFPGIELAFESLARDRSGIELLNVRSTADRTWATVFVPDGKLVHFEKLIQDYLEERRDSIGRARDHKRLVNAIRRSMLTLNSIAELRRAKETAEFFDSMEPAEQREWLDDLLRRTSFAEDAQDVAYVCLLDTGVTRGHPLLVQALARNDLHAVEPAWPVGDDDGHGTAMAGLALAGDLTDLLAGTARLAIEHRLESVKLLRGSGSGGNDPHHHGYLTIQAVARPEITASSRRRVFMMAVTARDNRDRGRPSAWSAALDALAADSDEYGARPRLLVVAAGNVSDPAAWSNYPDSNETDGVHDPAQAWNALTVGACTEHVRITEPDADDYQPIAPRGGLSPFSTTSVTWKSPRPLKPDVVLEGGNAAQDSLSASWMPSLSLLTTNYRPENRLFTTANATSAAAALAARMSAQIMTSYPDLWPETIRDLIVQTAEWTDAMKRSFLPARQQPSKKDYQRLVQRCGFGVPNLDRALWSAAKWTIGVQARHRGSLHSDTWTGTAADLASRAVIAVYPAMGWWKSRPALERYNRAARYALVVSIKAPGVDVDLYTEVANRIRTAVAVKP